MKISTILKQRRLDLNLTQEQVAEKIFVSTKSISNWENDKNFPDIESLVQLAKLYNFSLDSLLLEGSDIMNDIKKKEKAYELQKISLLGPQLTNFILFLMLVLSSNFKNFYMSDYIIVLTILAAFSNVFTVFYFTNQLKKYDIKVDELTNEVLRRGCEFSHIRSVTMYKYISDNIDNGLIVNKETHNLITSRGVNDEDELRDLCEGQNWNIDWYDKYIENLENII